MWKLSSRRMLCDSFCGLSEAAEDSRCRWQRLFYMIERLRRRKDTGEGEKYR